MLHCSFFGLDASMSVHADHFIARYSADRYLFACSFMAE